MRRGTTSATIETLLILRGWPVTRRSSAARPSPDGAGGLWAVAQPGVAGSSPSGTRSAQQVAHFVSGLDGFPPDLVEPLRRVPGRRPPDVDHRDGILPRVQHRGRGTRGKLLVLAGAERVTGAADRVELPFQPLPVGDRAAGVARQV